MNEPDDAGPLDGDGYPTEATLDRLRTWDIQSYACLTALWSFARELWAYPDYFYEEDDQWHVSTGGWSGNEDVLGALQKNVVFWMLCWQQSRRGGHYIFDLRREKLGCTMPETKP